MPASPYLVPTSSGVSFTAIVTAGDSIGTRPDGSSSLFAGKPDGIGAFDNGDGTITVLLNHEFPATSGIIRAHGSAGAFVDKLIIDKTTLAVVASEDLVKQVALYDDATDAYVVTTTAFAKLCSGDLPSVSAFYDAASGLGTRTRIYLSGEESGPEGRAFAFVATGAQAGTAYELPWLGRFSYENALAAPGAGAQTVVIGTNDSDPGQVYVYVGQKKGVGTAVEKAGLTDGVLYGISVEGLPLEGAGSPVPGGQGHFSLVPLGDVSKQSGAMLQALSEAGGVTEFRRPEDGAWDPTNPNAFYFTTTGTASVPSRLYRLDFFDVSNPGLGGQITLLLEGSEGHRSLDNIDVTDEGLVILQEDPGDALRLARIWEYDPVNDALTELAKHDPARFGENPLPPFTTDEESSGILDVSKLLSSGAEKTFLLDVQAHYDDPDPRIVEGGQLLVMKIAPGSAPMPDGDGRFAVGDSSVFEPKAGSATQLVFTISRLEGSSGAASIKYSVLFLDEEASGEDFGAGALAGTLSFAPGETAKIVSLTVQGDGAFEGDELVGIVLSQPVGVNGLADPVALGRILDREGVLLAGGEGDDDLAGTARDDRIFGNGGRDVIAGYGGDDTLFGGSQSDRLKGNRGDDTLYGGENADRLEGGRGDDRLFGGTQRDVLYGADGADYLNGGDEDDYLSGGRGSDVIYGGEEDDRIAGGGGADTMTGGSGADTFLFDNSAVDGSRDLIRRFSRGQGDKVDLSAVDADSTVSGNQAFAFIGREAFSGTAGELRLFTDRSGNTIASGDVDGDRLADFQIAFASPATPIGALDFVF